MWEDKALRYYFVLIAAVNLLMTGPISVGIPVLADTRFDGGAVAFGTILSGFGGGSLLGIVVAGVSSRPSNRRFPMLMLGLTATMGVALALLGILPSVATSTFVAFIMGCAQGYVVIQFITWLQLRTPSRMLGRMMSVLMFAVVGMAPLSSAIAGALIQWSATFVMVGAGLLMVLVVAIAAVSPSVWRLGDEDASPEAHPPAPARKLAEHSRRCRAQRCPRALCFVRGPCRLTAACTPGQVQDSPAGHPQYSPFAGSEKGPQTRDLESKDDKGPFEETRDRETRRQR